METRFVVIFLAGTYSQKKVEKKQLNYGTLNLMGSAQGQYIYLVGYCWSSSLHEGRVVWIPEIYH